MKTKDAIQVSVQTHPNGYGLEVNGEKFMYFNEVELMAGFMSHVGLGETKSMEKGTILSMLMAAMLGDAYTDAVTTLKQRVGLLTSQYNTTIERMDKAIEYVNQAENTINGLMKRINDLEQKMKGTEADHAENKKVVDEAKKKLADIEKKADDVYNSLANSATILKAMEDAGKATDGKKGKKADKEGGEKPSKSTDGKPSGTTVKASGTDAKPAKGKGKTNRQERDEAILKKAQENPNIK